MAFAPEAALKSVGAILIAAIVFALVAMFPAQAYAERYSLTPHAKLRITVVQWIPSKGEYQRWDSVSGEFSVAADGAITLPLIGTLNVTDFDTTELATQITDRFKSKAGLLEAPNATVEVLEYPPIYVLGSVAAPGAKPFRPGMTVLQALSLSGGVFRPSTEEAGLTGQIGIVGDLEGTHNEILRAVARISRLQAEMAGKAEIAFPAEVMARAKEQPLIEIIAQEKIIFKARRNALDGQLQNLSELRNLLSSEIDILGQKTQSLEAGIKLVENELSDVKSLVDRGIATVSRRSELERALAGIRADRLDQITAIMRARQSLSEATRNEVGLRDKYQTDVSIELQQTQANLERLRIKEEVLKKTLALTAATASEESHTIFKINPELSFTVVRKQREKTEEFAASESTVLMPEDVLKVAITDKNKRWRGGSIASTTSNR